MHVSRAEETGFTILTANIGNWRGRNVDTPALADMIIRNGLPDLLLIQDAPWKVKIRDLAGALGRRHFLDGRDLPLRPGMGIISRYPLSNPRVINLPAVDKRAEKRTAAICADVLIGREKILACSVHLDSLSTLVRGGNPDLASLTKRELFDDTPRSAGVRLLLDWLPPGSNRIVIGGDFNTFPGSRPIRMMGNRFKDVLAGTSDYFGGTYIKVEFPIKPRIDYIFYSRGLARRQGAILRDTLGDHYPVRAELAITNLGGR